MYLIKHSCNCSLWSVFGKLIHTLNKFNKCQLHFWKYINNQWIEFKWVFWVSQVFQFLNAKCESAFLAKRNPRQINWTVLYRRKHKKGQSVSNWSQRLMFPLTDVLVWLQVNGMHSADLCYVVLPACVLQAWHHCSCHTCGHRTIGDHSTGLWRLLTSHQTPASKLSYML